MKKLIILLVVLATSCNQEASSKFSMHKYIGDYTGKHEMPNGEFEILDASLSKVNGKYYLAVEYLDPLKLDSTSRKNIIHDSMNGDLVDVTELFFDQNIELLKYWLNDPSAEPDSSFVVFNKKPHQN